MMFKRMFLCSFWTVWILGVTGCVPREDFEALVSCEPPEITLVDAREFFRGLPDEVSKVTSPAVLRLYVTSSDEEDNIYGAIYLQDHPADPVLGVELKTGLRDAYLLYPPGTEVFLNLEGLYVRPYKGGLQVGSRLDSFGNSTLGRIPGQVTKDYLLLSCEPVQEIIAKPVSADTLGLGYSFIYVRVDDVQLAQDDMCKNFAEPESNTIRTLNTCGRNKLELLNSGYSAFRDITLPPGMGYVQGVLKYRGSVPQVLLNSVEGVQLNDSRCDGYTFDCTPPVVNSTISEIKSLYQGQPASLTGKVLRVMVTADPSSGAFPGSLYLRDDSGGIRISLDVVAEVPDHWRKGHVLLIRLDETVIASDRGELVIGIPDGENWKPLPEDLGYRFIYPVDAPVADPLPFDIAMNEVSAAHIGAFVRFTDVQFAGTGGTLQSAFGSVVADCNGNALLTVLPGSYQENDLPEGMGDLEGILTYSNGFEFRPVLSDRVPDLAENGCDLFIKAEASGLSALRANMQEGQTWIMQNTKVEGIVISDSEHGNFEANRLLLQTSEGGLILAFDHPHNIKRGSLSEVNVLGGIMDTTGGIPVIYGLQFKQVVVNAEGMLPEPPAVSPDHLSNALQEGQWVKMYPVQMVDPEGMIANGALAGDCHASIPLRVLEGSVLKGSKPEGGSGALYGFVLEGYFYPGNSGDIVFTEVRMDCAENTEGGQDGILISELADPLNASSESNSRFIELYNAAEGPVDLSGWELRRYTNANEEYTLSTVIRFDNVEVQGRSAFVIAANALHFEQVYGFAPDMNGGTSTAADSNGDDNIVLVNPQGEVIDVFGVPGFDGTGTAHDFRDGRALRRNGVVRGRAVFDNSQWEIYNGYDNKDAGFKEHYAPGDFSPGRHQ